MREKSGARYRLNRWRQEQIGKGKNITYGDLVKQYVKLDQTEGKFKQAPSGRYVDFLSAYLSAQPDATREEAIRSWSNPESERLWWNVVSRTGAGYNLGDRQGNKTTWLRGSP
jgi:hypothetical protein